MLAGDASNGVEIVAYCAKTLGRNWPWLRPMAVRYGAAFSGRTRPRFCDVTAFLRADKSFQYAWRRHQHELAVAEWLPALAGMQPVAALARLAIPSLPSVGELAEWLALSPAELEWFADLKGLAARSRDAQLQHYNAYVLRKRSGGVRVIEAPKLRLKQMQRKILRQILDAVPVHEAVHGFMPGRSIRSFAEPHAGRALVLRMDLASFFPSVRAARVEAIFRTLGYPELVSRALTGLCTTASPRLCWQNVQLESAGLRTTRLLYARPHLPQGAPTSPALANFCMYRADCRLGALARSAGASYTRYADDLAFSGDARFAQSSDRFGDRVAAILLEESFGVHYRKTRSMRRSVRQHLAGLTVNARVTISRDTFEDFKATLHNCVVAGPEKQNRSALPNFRAHLLGRLSFFEMIDPTRSEKLRKQFERIDWTS